MWQPKGSGSVLFGSVLVGPVRFGSVRFGSYHYDGSQLFCSVSLPHITPPFISIGILLPSSTVLCPVYPGSIRTPIRSNFASRWLAPGISSSYLDAMQNWRDLVDESLRPCPLVYPRSGDLPVTRMPLVLLRLGRNLPRWLRQVFMHWRRGWCWAIRQCSRPEVFQGWAAWPKTHCMSVAQSDSIDLWSIHRPWTRSLSTDARIADAEFAQMCAREGM